MNNNEIPNKQPNNEVYHATSNLNTAIENPQMNMNNIVDVNIQNTGNINVIDTPNNYYSNTQNLNTNNPNTINTTNSFIQPNINANQNNQNPYQNINETENKELANKFVQVDKNETVQKKEEQQVTYEPTLEQAKKKSKITISKELKITVLIVLILIAFLFALPYIYDFFKGLRLVVSG